ncbi:LAMI_0E05270g1_1 [Lachancea mirantina]|uniref:LAMI_0E05270g1_1 n=1 Tax=Lachancea mirantina TaxID=1230905 RepID=A0A1G4JKZ7_9SACH|nr:LAMI_0E05270g1_1 [Lachancea mirantina]
MSEHVYQPTDVVLAKVKGFPAWPAMIIPEEIVPENVLKGRPGKPAKELDASETEESDKDISNYIVHSDFLKFRKNRIVHLSYCVKFFFDDSYIWVKPQDFKPLLPEECAKWLENIRRKPKRLVAAFEMAKRGPGGIDVWEFVEYGSQGKPDEEEYVEEEPAVEEVPQEPESSPHVSDVDEVQSLANDSDFDEEPKTRAVKARTSRAAKKRTRGGRDVELQELSMSPPPPSRTKARASAKKQKTPEIPKYKYEDDEDWSIVGLGPQNSSINQSNTLIRKLSQKRNLEVHNELKADLREKLSFAKKLVMGAIFSGSEKENEENLHMVIDELDQSLSLKGSQDELITVLYADNEILISLSALLNSKGDQLKEMGLWDKFQQWFTNVYGHEFVPDEEPWSMEKISELASQS